MSDMSVLFGHPNKTLKTAACKNSAQYSLMLTERLNTHSYSTHVSVPLHVNFTFST